MNNKDSKLLEVREAVRSNIKNETLKFLILNSLWEFNNNELIEINEITGNYIKENSNQTIEFYYYEKGNYKTQEWILSLLKEKHEFETNNIKQYNKKSLNIKYRLNSEDFMKLVNLLLNKNISLEKKELYKQLILNFSNNLILENLEDTVDLIIATRNRDKEQIEEIFESKELNNIFKSVNNKKETRIIKITKMVIITYWPVSCFHPDFLNKILFKKHINLIKEILTLQYNELINYIRIIKNINLEELFLSGSNKNIQFNYFLKKFTKYSPKDFVESFNIFLKSFEKLITDKYLIWYFKEKVPNKWNSVISIIEYIEDNKLFKIDNRIEEIFETKIKNDDFLKSFENKNFNPYSNKTVLNIIKDENIFLKNIIKLIQEKHEINSFNWLCFYVYANETDKSKFFDYIINFFESKNVEFQNQILTYYLSFYPKPGKTNFKFMYDLLYELDKNNFSIPRSIKEIQLESKVNFNYEKSYIFIESLKKRENLLKMIYNKIDSDFIYNFDKTDKILPSIYYLLYSNEYNMIKIEDKDQIKDLEFDKITKFISILKKN